MKPNSESRRRFDTSVRDAATAVCAICKSHLPQLICARLFAHVHVRLYLLLLLHVGHVRGLVPLRHGGGPDLNHLLRLRHNRVPDLLLLCHGGHYRRGCEACWDSVGHLGLGRFKQRRYDGADDMYARALQARWMCLLLIDAGHNKEGKGGWDEECHMACWS